jgi:hypothetical protein
LQVYAAWETDEVIGFELWRNLGLGIACVFVITIILLADLRICFFVLVKKPEIDQIWVNFLKKRLAACKYFHNSL